MRIFVLSGTALALVLSLAACVTPQQRAAEIAETCASSDFVRIDAPENAQAYRDAVGEPSARYLRRRWPFHEYWFRNAAAGRTILCNADPDWHPTREQKCDDRYPLNEVLIVFQDTPAGPKMVDEGSAICVT